MCVWGGMKRAIIKIEDRKREKWTEVEIPVICQLSHLDSTGLFPIVESQAFCLVESLV